MMWTRAILLLLTGQAFNLATCQRRHLGCSLEVVVEPGLKAEVAATMKWPKHSSLDEYETLLKAEIAQMVSRHVGFANGILGKYQVGNNTDRASFRLYLKSLKILDYDDCVYHDVDYCSSEATSYNARDLLELHSRSPERANFCLSYVFSSQSFSSGTMGLAYTATTAASTGGICHRGHSVNDGNSSDTSQALYLNTGTVSFFHAANRLPEEVTKVAFAHEIGHSFGSPHDFPLSCLKNPRSGRHYLMHPHGGKAFHLSTEDFSACSLGNMSRVLNNLMETGRGCFTDVPLSTCGNGIVEGWEECDCGVDCTDSCCKPFNAPRGACQLVQGASCSPSEGPCCNAATCSFYNESHVCLAESDCHGSVYCDGIQTHCPARFPKNPGRECQNGSKVCDAKGYCSRSICTKFNFEECAPNAKSEHQCEIHCQAKNQPSTCRPTSTMPILFHKGPVNRPESALCAMPELGPAGFCSAQGHCITYSEALSAKSSNSGWIVGVVIFLVCYIILTVVAVWIYYNYCRGKREERAVVKY